MRIKFSSQTEKLGVMGTSSVFIVANADDPEILPPGHVI